MVLPKKKVPPPPKQPGTHTNAEVKEALHARALRRTIIVTAVVVLLLAALAVVSSIAQEYQGEDDTEHIPKAIVIVAEGLRPFTWDRNMRSGKAPFTRLLQNAGGIYTTLSAVYNGTAADRATNLVRLLTGSAAASVAPTLINTNSFLKVIKSKFRPMVVAPTRYWSSNQVGNSSECTRVGFFDAECTGAQCPEIKEQAYCNAYRKYVSCGGEAELYNDEVVRSFSKALEEHADLLYIQLTSFEDEEDGHPVTMGSTLQGRSSMNLIDGAFGRIALALAERTKHKKENWLLVVTSEGANPEHRAPLLMSAYSNGQLVQLRQPKPTDNLRTSDIYGTLLRWFGLHTSAQDEKRLVGICSTGSSVINCNTPAVNTA